MGLCLSPKIIKITRIETRVGKAGSLRNLQVAVLTALWPPCRAAGHKSLMASSRKPIQELLESTRLGRMAKAKTRMLERVNQNINYQRKAQVFQVHNHTTLPSREASKPPQIQK